MMLSTLQDAAVTQALAMLSDSLTDVSLTVKVLQQGNIPITLRLISTVTEADSRAGDVSGMFNLSFYCHCLFPSVICPVLFVTQVYHVLHPCIFQQLLPKKSFSLL